MPGSTANAHSLLRERDPVPASAWGDGVAWDREYADVCAIPSSHRLEPSRAFTRLAPALGDLAKCRVLDLGAGTGRHSTYLSALGARVHAVDPSDVACHLLRLRSEAQGVRVNIDCTAIDEHHLPDGKYDLIIDSYASCHILATDARLRFLDALMTRLAPGGRLYTAGMGTRDSFYRRHIVPHYDETIAVDPTNNIAKLLQPSDVSERDSRTLGSVISCWTARFVDLVGAREEQREVHATVLGR